MRGVERVAQQHRRCRATSARSGPSGRCARCCGWRSAGSRRAGRPTGAPCRRAASGSSSSATSSLRALPGRGRGLDDPCALAGAVPIGAEHPDAVLVLGEVEGEGVMRPGRAEPEEAVAAVLDARPEPPRGIVSRTVELIPSAPTSRSKSRSAAGSPISLSKRRFHAEPGAAPLQHVEQRAARAAAEAVPAAAHRLAVEDEVDLVPVDEDVADRVVALRVVVAEIVQRLVGEHDAEAERVVAPVALVDRDLPARPGLLRQQREIEPPPRRRRPPRLSWRSGRGPTRQAIAALSRSSSVSRNWLVVWNAWSGPTRIARSLVMNPSSTAFRHTPSSVSAKRTTSGVSSNVPR